MAPVLHGVRGEPPVDLPALAAAVARFSTLVAATGDFAELELNPLVVGPAQVVAVDARGMLQTPLT